MDDARREPTTPTQPSMPESKKTTQLPAVPEWAIELTKSLKAGFVAAEERFDKQDATLLSQGTKLDKVITEGIEANTRMTRFEVRLEDLEGAKTKYSGGIKTLSQSDAGQNMQISSLALKVDALDAKTTETHAMLGTITGLLDKPLVKKLGWAAGGLLLAGLTSATGYLARGNVQTPQPTIIQVAPVVTADGGAR